MPLWGSICAARYLCGEYIRTSMIFILSQKNMAAKESKPSGHRNCLNTPPSHKHC